MCNTINNTEYQTAQELKNEGLVHDKIEEAKKCFENITKTGRNNYQKYNYLELHDILPVVRNVCTKYRLRTRFQWTDISVTLRITDREDGSSEYFTIPIPSFNIEDPDKYMKAVGKVQTYAMRYLYIQAFEIAVPDKIDQGTKPNSQRYTNGNKLGNANKAEPVDQTTLNTKQTRNIQDLARNIAEQMSEKGIETNNTNIRGYLNELFTSFQISKEEFRELKKLYPQKE